jgi:UTP--glucose-1-phosphate uridylyltransferase
MTSAAVKPIVPPIKKAVFPVAGMGTRFLPATKVMPKEMLTVHDRPLIQHVVEEAQQAGIEEFIFVTNREKEILEDHFKPQEKLEKILQDRGKDAFLNLVRHSNLKENQLKVVYQDEPLGLGHAIWCAKDLIGNEPFAIFLTDDIVLDDHGCMAQMMDVYTQKGGNVIALKNIPKADTQKYGIVDVGNEDNNILEIKGLVEKPNPDDAPSTLSIVGRYILQPEVMEYLSAHERGAGGEIQLTDSMAKLIGDQAFHGLKFNGQHFDCGGALGFIEANVAYGLSDPSIKDMLLQNLKKYQ